MGRPSRARVNLTALRENFQFAAREHGGRALAVVKANAYGHGAVRCAQALEDIADGFAVAFLEEGLALRSAGIQKPILLLEGVFAQAEMAKVRAMGLWIVVHHEHQLRMIEACEETERYSVWLKADSGMHRAGFPLTEVSAAYSRLLTSKRTADITLMTHFARADELESAATERQIAAFDSATLHLPGARSLSNSAGLLRWPAARRDWARPGVMLYGVDPAPMGDTSLKPVMTLESQVFAVQTLRAGDPLGYGAAFVARQPTRVGLVAIGYADGYPRSAKSGTPVVADGQSAHLIGRVSMDMLTIDITHLPEVGIGSSVELWGERVSVSTIAELAGTIPYELLCNVKRVPVEYFTAES